MIKLSLSAQDMTCSRNNQILFSAINFNLSEGHILHIRGENGIGKTTLLRCLAGISTFFSGKLLWEGENIFDSESYQRQLYFLGHRNTVKSALTAKENLLFALNCVKPSAEQIDRRLKQVDLYPKATQLAGTFSAGQKQRLAIAKLLLSETKVWILDEPFTSLDLAGTELLQQIMIEHQIEQGIIIFTSHFLTMTDYVSYQELKLVPVQPSDTRF